MKGPNTNVCQGCQGDCNACSFFPVASGQREIEEEPLSPAERMKLSLVAWEEGGAIYEI
ncbi:MAG: hypothetical protein UV63_C0014G0005 [Microgenomates group bacterium GW2011_GWC1_43_11]|uniref:Uncharacterized protein n=2 Tax=Candidatus Gottesmaniibacteriota TaxID=1752720 RepID=A0A0G1IDA4_9BACT|nr:MAG: hypothetical protein UV63_C0014G0005 [Microgenomates group bacterium GW2011_GWC1_43_11]KKT35161.1 MAG: hypothetical protein UW22_C0058G0007 [Candidatus Gottesmanbacteria bacterium GW2011_GWB1_44_11c]KKT57376.1 MAG: hypothetical protein UW52_C0068G0007 [Candidatus Gottesmanbacteria bacterium GW2011_GWA1_44_24b]